MICFYATICNVQNAVNRCKDFAIFKYQVSLVIPEIITVLVIIVIIIVIVILRPAVIIILIIIIITGIQVYHLFILRNRPNAVKSF